MEVVVVIMAMVASDDNGVVGGWWWWSSFMLAEGDRAAAYRRAVGGGGWWWWSRMLAERHRAAAYRRERVQQQPHHAHLSPTSQTPVQIGPRELEIRVCPSLLVPAKGAWYSRSPALGHINARRSDSPNEESLLPL